MSTRSNPGRARLAARLRELRAQHYRSASEFGRAVGWEQSRVSKLERGAQMPTDTDLETWAHATDPNTRDELKQLRGAARVVYSVWADSYRTGDTTARQDAIAADEATTRVIRCYQPALIPGLLQTPDYTRELLAIAGGVRLTGATEESIEAIVAGRVRRQNLLYDTNREVQVVLGEAALRIYFGTIATLRAQLDRLVSFAALPTLDLRALPTASPSPLMPLAGFDLHDDDALIVETLTGEQRIDNPEEVTAHRQAFDLAHEAALHGNEAMDFIQSVAHELQDGGRAS
jgi:transcriptional regulator with XRE-family HTH domain